MAAAVVRRGPAGWWRWHRRVMGKDLPLPLAPAAPLCRAGGERPGLSRGAQLPRCPWRPRVPRARCGSGAASPCGVPGDGARAVTAGTERYCCCLIRGSAGASERLALTTVFTHLLKIACLEIVRAHKCFLWQR